MSFRHPGNGYIERGGSALSILWCLLFGPLYFASKGIWTHTFVSLIAAISTAGLSWLIYPFFAPGIVDAHYQRAGWLTVETRR
jgi:hypothetical protein